jgi:hypothetical protein
VPNGGPYLARLIVVGSLGTLAAACSSPAPSTSPPRSTNTSMSTSTTTRGQSLISCSADQLDVEYRGTQGATGNYFAAFWIADTSAASCTLPSQVTVNLLDAQNVAQRSATYLINASIPLSARALMPADGMNPAQGESLAYITLEWPTVFDSGLGPVIGSSKCPQPAFVPTSVRITLGDQAPILVNILGPDIESPDGIGSLCGPNFSINSVGPL